jgi:hypothetical protein
MEKVDNKIVVGAKESIDLPDLGLFGIATRIDTGAKTTALHVDHMVLNEETGMIDFEFHPDSHDVEKTIKCSAKIVAKRRVKSSNGSQERRYVINTRAVMGSLSWRIRVSLTDRSDMNHLMLLGRLAMRGRMIVDPELDYIATQETSSVAQK